MSIVRVGLAETKDFSDGYDRIFGKKEEPKSQEQPQQQEQKTEDAPTCQTNQPK